MMTNHIERTAVWRLVQASVLVVTVGLLPLGIGCNNENSPSASDPSAKEGGTETTFKLSGAENNEDASDGERPTQNGGVDWHALMATPPEEWSDELKTQITAAGYDLDETTVGIRMRQAWAAVAQSPADEWTQEQRILLIEAGLDPEEVAAQMLAAEEHDGRSADEDEALREFQRGVAVRAMAIPPEEWNDRLKAAIVQAGWDLDEFTEGIRQRQAAMREESTTTCFALLSPTGASGSGAFQPSDDRSKMLVRKGNGLFIVPTGGGAVQLNNDSDVDLRGWTMSFDPREEWRQMFVESWRLMRDYFYDRDMHSVDWQAELDRHLPLVERVATRSELSDLLAQMVSEIGALHHFVYGGDQERTDERIAPASLGARLPRDEHAGGAVIEHIFGVDPDEPERRGPLARMDLDIEVGDVITMINGVRVLDAPDLGARLRTEAGKQVRLRSVDAEDGTERDVSVIPESQGEASDRRYHEWEYTRRLRTEEASDGRLGYVHLRAMGTGDMADFVRGFYPVFQREGLIIDVRHNNGGNIDSWIISRLLRKAWSFWQGNAGAPDWNMQYAFRGHLGGRHNVEVGAWGAPGEKPESPLARRRKKKKTQKLIKRKEKWLMLETKQTVL